MNNPDTEDAEFDALMHVLDLTVPPEYRSGARKGVEDIRALQKILRREERFRHLEPAIIFDPVAITDSYRAQDEH